jgi:hypothetical protein
VDFDVTGQLLNIYTAFVKYLRKNVNTYNEVMYPLFIDFKKAYDSFRWEVLHNIEFGIPMKLVRLIKNVPD